MHGVNRALTAALLDDDLIAPLQVDVGGRAGRQLEHAARTDLPPDHAIPAWEPAIHLLHAFAGVQKYRVDREVHEHHVDSAARVDPHSAARGQAPAKHQAQTSAEHRARHLELLGEDL